MSSIRRKPLGVRRISAFYQFFIAIGPIWTPVTNDVRTNRNGSPNGIRPVSPPLRGRTGPSAQVLGVALCPIPVDAESGELYPVNPCCPEWMSKRMSKNHSCGFRRRTDRRRRPWHPRGGPRMPTNCAGPAADTAEHLSATHPHCPTSDRYFAVPDLPMATSGVCGTIPDLVGRRDTT